MAWNEPGKDKKRDPWAEGDPSDLDQALRQLKERFGRLFGGGGGGDGAGGGSGGGFGMIALIVLALVLVVALFDSFQQVNESTRGVVLRFGKYQRTMGAGLNFKWPRPIEEVRIVEIARVQSFSAQRVRMLTSDENLLDIDFNVQYRVEDPQQWLFDIRSPEGTLAEAAESAVRQVVGAHSMDTILSEERTAMAQDAKSDLQKLLENYHTGIVVTNVNFQNLRPPERVQAAFDYAIAAREDNQRFKNQAEAYSSKVLPEARGHAARIRTQAEGEKQSLIAKATGETNRFELLLGAYQKAPLVTRRRLFLETMQEVLANNPKLMIDVRSGSNSLMMLPLEKLLQGAGVAALPGTGAASASGSSSAPAMTAKPAAPVRAPNDDPLRPGREPRQ